MSLMLVFFRISSQIFWNLDNRVLFSVMRFGNSSKTMINFSSFAICWNSSSHVRSAFAINGLSTVLDIISLNESRLSFSSACSTKKYAAFCPFMASFMSSVFPIRLLQ